MFSSFEIEAVQRIGTRLSILLKDQRVITVPLRLFPRLALASERQLDHYELSPDRTGIHWPDLDEDISVPVLMGHPS